MQFYNFKINKFLLIGFVLISLVGFLDSIFLTVKYFVGTINCSTITGCQDVLSSPYSNIFGIPVALLGAFFYLSILVSALIYIQHKNKLAINALAWLPSIGLLFSIWLVYLQLIVIKSICIYCMGSALTSTVLFILSIFIWKNKINQVDIK